MTTTHLPTIFQCIARAVLPLLVVAWASLAYAQSPAQIPLLSKGGAGVRPNIMLTLDDSGSMAFRHMPEDVFASDTFATANPVNSNTVIWDLSDDYQAGTNYLGMIPGSTTVTNWVLRAMRSPDTNTMYYNPEIRYQPWFNDDGVTRRPNSPVTTAYITPPLKATTATSVTSLAVAIGNKTLTLAQTGKSFAVNQYVLISSTATPTSQWMYGQITAFNAGTGAMTVNVSQKAGTSTLSSWNVIYTDFVDLTTSVVIPGGIFAAGTFVTGQKYRIVVKGNTTWTNIGAANNNVGTVFTATGPGAGTGTAGLMGLCFANPTNVTGNGSGAGGGCEPASGPFTHDPGVYFRLQKTGAVYKAVAAAGNYTAYSINVGATFPKVAARTDCAGAVGATGCSQAEERQNFANWYSYYRNRNLLARGALMEAFGPDPVTVAAGTFVVGARYRITSVGSTAFTTIGATANTVGTIFDATGVGAGTGTAVIVPYRLGFGRINKGAATVDAGPTTTTVIESSTTYGGGGVRDYGDARRVNLFKWLEDLPASGGTPLVTAMEAVGAYYARTDARSPWTDDPSVATNTVANNKTCRRSYNIMTTDGYWNGAVGTAGNADATAGAVITGPGGNSYTYAPVAPFSDGTANTLADVAMYYWKTDLQPSMDNSVTPVGDNISFWQNMTNFTVGLGVRGTLNPKVDLPALTAGSKTWPAALAGATGPNVDDLWHAAVNSRGQYFSAKDPKELADAIKSALISAGGDSKPTAGVATASTVLSANNRKYVPTFKPVAWNGDVIAYRLNGVIADVIKLWNAADPTRMPAWSARNVVTWDTGVTPPAAVAFDWANMSASNRAALGTAVAGVYTTDFTNFIKGDHSKEGFAQPFRLREDDAGVDFILGDFVNANPVAVLDSFNGLYTNLGLGVTGSPTNPTYPEFLVYKAARTSVLFAGANDGMLHGFKDSRAAIPAADDGKEVFAYVPRAVYPNLDKLADKTYGTSSTLEHQYFVDGPLREADAYVKAPGATSASWRNYLLGSLGAGGRAVFALDVTDLANLNASTVRWEISSSDDADLGYMLAPIKVGVLANGRWVAIFGNGYSSTNGYATLFVVDIEDAASSNATTRANARQKLNVDTLGANGLGGVTLIHDASGYISNIYVGDLKGKLWRFDYSASAASKFVISGGSALFTATDSIGVAQPITASPVVFNHTLGGKIVVFGTGKLFATADSTDTSPQTIYSVWDKPSDSFTHPLGRTSLTGRTLTSFVSAGTTFYSITDLTAVDWNTKRGWYIDLSAVITGGRVVYPSLVAGFDTAIVSSVAPVQGVPTVCGSLSGTAVNFALPVQTGLNPLTHTFDTSGDGVSNASDSYAVGYATAADGVDVVVRSQGVNGSDGLRDIGGGGGEGDCTGAVCSASGNNCVPDPTCPDEVDVNGATHKRCLGTIQSAQGGITGCIDSGIVPPPTGTNRQIDRVWRRIINPPIR